MRLLIIITFYFSAVCHINMYSYKPYVHVVPLRGDCILNPLHAVNIHIMRTCG
jgi:hypothetical protein